MTTGLLIGRFEPPHKGHMEAIKEALALVDTLFVLIGSSQEELTAKNCFSLSEREHMLQEALKEYGIDVSTITFISTPDCQSNDEWSENVLKEAGPVDLVISGNKLVQSIFKGKGYKVHDPEINMVYPIHASDVRKLMRTGEQWEHHVPVCVKEFILSHDLVSRVKELENKESHRGDCQ